MTRFQRVSWLLVLLLFQISSAIAQEIAVGRDVVFVERRRADGSDRQIPLHPAVGNNSVSARLPSSSTAQVLELGPHDRNNWIHVRAGTTEGWVITRYVAEILTPPGAPGTSTQYVIGCWNLEHFRNGATRGFPENTSGGPSYPARTQAQIREIAQTITGSLNAQLLVLNEINGHTGQDADGDDLPLSEELDSLLLEMPSSWDYILSWSGGSQRIAILYNDITVRVNEATEFVVAPRRIQQKDIFDRDPLAVHVTFLENGQPRNDLVVVGVHLASGQGNNRNHDEAMRVLLRRLEASQNAGELGGSSEHDVVIMGDYNANAFLPPVENFFVTMDEIDGPWDVLAGNDYPATRFSSVPLRQFQSQIDYIIASRFLTGTRTGLSGEEITAATATVHAVLITEQGGADNFRRDLSDHLPVTAPVFLGTDND